MNAIDWHKVIGTGQIISSILTGALTVMSQPNWVPNQNGWILIVIAVCNALSGIHKVAEIKPVGS